MSKIVGFIFGAVAGLVVAAWLYGGSTWGPGFAAKETAQKETPPQFKLSGEPVPAEASETRLRETSEQSAPSDAKAPDTVPAPAFNTGGNPNVNVGAGPNWGLGFRLGRTTNGTGNQK